MLRCKCLKIALITDKKVAKFILGEFRLKNTADKNVH